MTASTLSRVRLLPMAAAMLGAMLGGALVPAQASSHREAPFITSIPKVDNTDVYAFASYEPGREGYITLISNFLPLQDPYGGPNYFSLDPHALYEIHVDNDGDGKEDLSFQFRFQQKLNSFTVPVGNRNVEIPLIQKNKGVANVRDANLNVNETYTVDVMRGHRRRGFTSPITNADGGGRVFNKPVDNIGEKTIPDYSAYADKHIYDVKIPNCQKPGRLFVGQRKEAFAVNLGVIFDLINAPASFLLDNAQKGVFSNTIDDANITSLALEVHKDCLTQGTEPVIGVWSTASLPQGPLHDPNPLRGFFTSRLPGGGAWSQLSRLGMPLVNEVVIGLSDKDRFNSSQPKDDGQFAEYVTHPTLPALIEVALGVPNIAPKNLPRNDLVVTFLTGIKGVNQPKDVKAAEMLRLNTSTPPVAEANQNRLGIVGNILAGGTDSAGFPNGRRPKDDIVDIALVAVMGGLCVANGNDDALGFGKACNPSAVPLGEAVFGLHDGVDQAKVPLLPRFPYLFTPTPGSGNNITSTK